MAAHIASSIGHYGMHGYSATFDCVEAIDKAREKMEPTTTTMDDNDHKNEPEPLKILLVGPGDIRHILSTISRRKRHQKGQKSRPLHFYLIENPIEILAREMLMLELLMDFEVPIRQRASIFLEIYGNCKLQDRTARYVEQLGHELRFLIADGKGRMEDLIDLSIIRSQEILIRGIISGLLFK